MKTSPFDLHAAPQGRKAARITARTPAGKEWLRVKCGLSPGHYPAGLICPILTVWQTLNAARDSGLIVETGEQVAEHFAETPAPLGELFAVFRDIAASPSRYRNLFPALT